MRWCACSKITPSPAVILQNHGVFTVGKTPKDAVKAAVMCEDVARTSFLALQLGTPLAISDEDVAKLHHRYNKRIWTVMSD